MPHLIKENLGNQLIDLLNQAWTESQKVSEIDLARIRKKFVEIENKIDEASKYEALGMIATLEGNISNVHKYHSISTKLDSSSLRKLNYAASLNRVGLTHFACDIFEQEFEKDRSNRRALYSLIEGLNLVGRYKKALQLKEHLSEEELEQPEVDFDVIKTYSELQTTLEIDDPELALYAQSISELLDAKNIVSRRTEVQPVMIEGEDGDSSFFEILVRIIGSLDNAISLGGELYDRLASKSTPDNISTRVTVRFSPAG
jgi:tetratricopeptide (TPR) repeat protein